MLQAVDDLALDRILRLQHPKRHVRYVNVYKHQRLQGLGLGLGLGSELGLGLGFGLRGVG